MELTIVVHREERGYWSSVKELPGCFASGRTLAELREAVGESVGLYLWDRPVTLGDQELWIGDVQVEVEQPTPS